MKVKSGDEVEFLAISWDEENWDFGHPTVVLKPVVKYSDEGSDPEGMIEDIAIDLCCEEDLTDEDASDGFGYRCYSLAYIKKIAREVMAGKDTWKTKIRSVVRQKIRFYEEDGEISHEILETSEFPE